MSRTEVRITGYGGQGVVLSAHILGRACAVHAGKHATMIQSFGPEARGSACSATLAISDEEVLYPYIRRPDVFVAMSGEAYNNFKDELKDDGILIFEKDLVQPRLKEGQPGYGVPSTRIAESLGRSLVQNIVMLGFVSAATKIVDRDDIRGAVEASVPSGTEELNLQAFDAGWGYYDENYGSDRPTAEAEGVAAAATGA